MKDINYSRGFSLLEILIAAFLGVFLFGIILQSYLTAKNIYRAQDELISFNGNFRLADFILRQYVMQAGFAGCRTLPVLELYNRTGITDFNVSNLRGYDEGSIPSYLKGRAKEGSDILVVSKAAEIIGSVENGLVLFKKSNIKKARFLLVADCKNAELFKLSDKENKDLVLERTYHEKNIWVRKFEEVSFFVSKRGEDKKDCLYFSVNRGRKEELVPNVSGMGILYKVNGKYLKAGEVGENLWNKVSAVKIELVLDSKLFPDGKVKREIYIKLRGVG